MRYKDYSHVQFNAPRAIHRHDWRVAPTTRTRDSGALEQSNFATMQKMLDDEHPDLEYEIHHFRHWGLRWIEIILLPPCEESDLLMDDITRALENYPALSEDDWSERKYEAAREYWEWMTLRDRITECKRQRVSIFAARHSELPSEIDYCDWGL